MEITGSFPAGVIGDTKSNLEAAAAGENYEHTQMYPEFAEVAENEGFSGVASVFENIAVAEQAHEARYRALIGNLENDMVFKRDTVVKWKCRNCGYVHEGTEAVEKCPACAHERAYFEVWARNY